MIVKKYQACVVSHTNQIDSIYTLELASSDRPFKYNCGQFLHLAIDDYDGIGQWPESRCFSMQSDPKEETLKLTYAAKGKFTRGMAEKLKPGSLVWIKLPYGNLFENQHNPKNSVFIAGGTGITPFLSLFNHQSFSEYQTPVLFFGIREEKYHLYKAEFEKAKLINPGLIIEVFIESQKGRPPIDQIISFNKSEASYFISGPPQMISFYKNSLFEAGIHEQQILTDDWE